MKEFRFIISIFAFSILITDSLQSQDGKFALGAEFSTNWSRLSNGVIGEKFKQSAHFFVRIEYQSKSRFSPTIGIGYLNTGEQEEVELGGQLGIEKIKFQHNYNYVVIPIGVNINIGNYYVFPEIGIGFNTSNKMRLKTFLTNGDNESEIEDERLNVGEFNKITYPIFLTIGRSFKVEKSIISLGIKAYYGLNQVVKDVPRDNHYYGLGFTVLTKRNTYHASEE